MEVIVHDENDIISPMKENEASANTPRNNLIPVVHVKVDSDSPNTTITPLPVVATSNPIPALNVSAVVNGDDIKHVLVNSLKVTESEIQKLQESSANNSAEKKTCTRVNVCASTCGSNQSGNIIVNNITMGKQGNMSTKKKRKGSTRTCERCHKRHQKCIFEEGATQCKSCIAAGTECVPHKDGRFNSGRRPTTRRKRIRRGPSPTPTPTRSASTVTVNATLPPQNHLVQLSNGDQNIFQRQAMRNNPTAGTYYQQMQQQQHKMQNIAQLMNRVNGGGGLMNPMNSAQVDLMNKMMSPVMAQQRQMSPVMAQQTQMQQQRQNSSPSASVSMSPTGFLQMSQMSQAPSQQPAMYISIMNLLIYLSM